MVRDTAHPVEGHVEASTPDEAYNALSQNGVVTESLVADPKPLDMNEQLPTAPQFADALDSAFDSSSSQVDFDALTDRYHGKKVWVIDRDKIRRRVAQVVDAALALSHLHDEGASQTRERVNSAIQAMFNDNRNLASERNADSIAGVRFNGGGAADRGFVPPPPPPPPMSAPAARVAPYFPATPNGGTNGGNGHAGLESQLARMANMVKQAESALSAIQAVARSGGLSGGGGGGGGGRRRSAARAGGRSEEQNGVLLEIFKSNLALVRSVQGESAQAAAAAAPAGE
jgi:hypothetical protein